MPSLSKRSYLGVGVEATAGTALATPTVYHPCKSIMKGTKKREMLKEERATRDGVYGIVDTTREGATDPKGFFYADTSPYFILGAFGAVSSAAQSLATVYKHTFSLADIPKTLTVFKSYDYAVYVGAYSLVEKWDLKWSAEGKLLENDVSLKHLYPVKYSGSALTPTFSQVQPFAGYAPQITLAGVVSTDIDDVSISFDQKYTLWYPSGGSADFLTAYPGERNVKVTFTARFDTDALYNHFLSRVDDSFLIDVKGAVIGKTQTVTIGAASAGTFTLTYGGQTTAGIAYNAASSAVQTALQGLSSIGSGNATVSGSAGGPYTVTFAGPTLNDGNTLTGSGTGLTGGSFAVGAQTLYNQELNVSVPIISYDSMDHDLGKDNVLIKVTATGIAGTSPMISAFVQNLITGYTV